MEVILYEKAGWLLQSFPSLGVGGGGGRVWIGGVPQADDLTRVNQVIPD